MTGTVASAPVNGQRAKKPEIPIGDVRWRQQARVHGRIRSMRVQPWANVASLECVVVDDTGGLVIVFLGRRAVAGLELGRWLYAEGVVGAHRGYLAMLNPEIELIVQEHPGDSSARTAKAPKGAKRQGAKKRWWKRG
jgi:RecG-like helicase